MSLQIAAQHLASRGRGPDTQLVHMAPQEVAGLHALAKAHGGSLTTNPDTGLPEAGFLSSLLPTLIGAALAPFTGGLSAALITGAGYTAATGSLKKGLMAGLGAFGGAGLASSVLGAGTAAGTAAATGEAAAAGSLASETALAQAQAQASQAAALNPVATANAAATATPDFAVFNAAPQNYGPLGELPGSYVPPTQAAKIVPTTVQAPVSISPSGIGQVSAQDMIKAGFSPEQIAQSAQDFASNQAGNAASPFTQVTQDALKSPLGAGIDAIKENPDLLFNKGNLKYALAAGLPLLMQEPEAAKKKPEEKPWMYSYDPGRVAEPYANRSGAYTGEVMHFNPTYTRMAADGGIMDSGPVQAMSDRNEAQTLMANNGQMFAEGGETKAVKPVEESPYYTMSGQSGDAFKYLMGQMPAPSKAQAPAAAPAQPVAATVQPAAETQKSIVSRLVSGLTGSDSDATMRPYTFDPVTGTFTAMPPVNNGDFDVGGAAQAYSNPNITPWDMGGTGGNANGGLLSLAQGGQSHLGDYSDGGRLLKGPGDGVSDSIPATIANKRPARLADGEFVVPARIVSELGNGSTEAGARKLYAMMDRVQNARKKSIGKDRVAVNSRAEKLLPI